MEHYLDIAVEFYFQGYTAKESVEKMLKVKEMEESKCEQK